MRNCCGWLCAYFSSEIRAVFSVAVAVHAITVAGCSRKDPEPNGAVSRSELNANPQTTSFAAYAQNSATLRDRVVVSGGDVGVRMAGAGPFLVNGYELALTSDVQVGTTHNVIGNRVLLQDRTRVGDVQVNQLTNQRGYYEHRYPFPLSMPALPPTAAVSPGNTPLSVNASSTAVASPGSYGIVSIGYRGVLRLQGGVYHLASLQIDNEARIEALAPVQVRVAGRFGAFDRTWIGAATGVTLTAGDLRVEVSGHNGSSGALADSPKAASLGNDLNIHGVMLVPNGTLQIGQRATMVGAYVARDVYVDIDSQITFQTGVGPSGCLQSCDDGNPCTTDTCSIGVCVHTSAAAGTSCGDGNFCNGTEACDGAGHCRAGTPVSCAPLDQCHTAGVCNPATGACSNPPKPNGTSCDDGNSCTKSDVCAAGACGGTTYACDDGLPCTSDSCNGDGTCTFGVIVGNCLINGACYSSGASNPANQCELCVPEIAQTAWRSKASGTSCNDGKACTANDVCDGAGHCAGTSYACNDGLPCTLDTCNGDGTCAFTVMAGNCLIDGACYATGTTSPTNQCQQCTSEATQTAWSQKAGGTSCSDGNACTANDACDGAGHCNGTAYICNDGLACTLDICNGDGTCTFTPSPESCVVGGICYLAGATSPNNDCQQCSPTSSQVSWTPRANGSPCNDGNACTSNDVCTAGFCGGARYGCDDALPCTADACNGDGTCSHTITTGNCVIDGACYASGASNPASRCQVCNPAQPRVWSNQADGTSCSDGNACTQTDTCQAGVCSGGNQVTCVALDQCHDVGACDTSTGVCSNPGKPDGTHCNDGNACTQTDTCQAGVCSGGNSVTCVALDQCHDVGACDTSTGVCSNPGRPDGTHCNDGDACTQADTCQSGSCIGANPVVCLASDQCHAVGTCDHTTGACSNPAKPEHTPCDDGDPSTQDDTCQAGVCVPGTPACAAVQDLDAGSISTCVVWTGGHLWCWGYDYFGQLGIGSTTDRITPAEVTATEWAAINMGSYSACGIRTDRSLWCWGSNSYGLLGIGTGVDHATVPMQVQGSDWARTSVGYAHTCATKTDGTLWCWGRNTYGQLGGGTASWIANPMQVAGTDWRDVAAGDLHTCATKTDGTLWCWGYNSYGQLGVGTTDVKLTTPTAVEGSGWASIGPGYGHTCATKTDGTLWCWGYNLYGQLGDGTGSSRNSPGQVSGSDWAKVGAGYGHTCATKTDGTLWCWGYNQSGQLGNGTVLANSLPAQLGGTNWTRVSVGSEYTCAAQSDRSLWCWGNNDYGQLGDGSTVNKTTPTQIGKEGCGGVCGDGHLDWREQCDDGNQSPGDGCSAKCQKEVCGNGILDPGEQCDDGNQASGDGCSSTCRFEPCGNGILDPGEECDDGNRIPGDGCSPTCRLEVCGNGILDPGEECDDGNQVDDDRCLSTCRINRCYHVWCSDQPCQIVACNPANGQCEGPPKPDGTACDDGSVCTQTDSCQAGQCLGSRPLDCTAKNGCQLDGTCDPAIGCVIPHLPDGTSCDDGTPCTTADACEAGECVGVVTNACFVGQVTPIDPISPTSLASSTAFLYSGSDAVQKGVAPGTIDPVTVAVLRGSVKTRDGTPISGIRVTIGQHPEFGETRTRENGVFDIAVNGGGELTLVFERRGYLRVERRAFAAWQDYTVLPDVVMTALDPVVTTIDLPSSLPQIAIGSEINDEDGRRQPMLLVPSGVSASMAGPDVSVPLNRLSVRLTEYTVGLNGPAAMPAPLPANSGYTYAVELSADEAIAANVVKVYFSKPLYFYVDNFLNLAVGASAPTGTIDQIRTLDNGTSTWEASASGRVVKVLAVINGMAELAVDGSGLPATAGALLALGVTDEERAQLARSFEPGKTLWRIPIAHFSSWDINLPYGYPHGIEYPHPDAPQKEECDECNDQESGSIIECENQVLGQEIQVAGTPFSLAYRSRESDGDKRPQTVSVPLGAISPAARALLKGVEVKLSIAGQIVEHDYSATSYPTDGTPLAFSWNGIDAYGRQVQGAQRATVTVGYKYPIFYRSQADLDIIFGEWATPPASIVSRQAATVTLLSDASNTSGIRGEPHLVLGSSRTPIGELGGWTLSAHHVYDPQSRVIYRGDGTLQTADDVKQVVRVIGGDGHYVSDVDPASSGPALQVPVDFSGSEQQRLAVGANGDVLFDDVAGPGRIDRAGNLTRAALTHYSDYYDCRTVGSDGRVCTLGFGRDVECRSADSLTVLLDRTVWVGAQFGGALYTLAPAPDGSVYLGTDNLYSTVFKLTLDGQVRQVAGTSQRGYSPDGTPAAQAQLDLWDIAVGSDGSLFINEATRIRRIGPDGILTTVAGTGVHGSSGDGGPATQAQIWARPEGIGGSASAMCGSLRVASDQTVYFMEQSRRIRRIGADGIISTYAGSGQLGAIIDGSSARSPLRVSVIATSPDGSIVFSGPSGYPESLHVYRISPPLPGYQASQTAIASKDGQEIYVFDAEGRHLRTEDARTGTIVHRFGYTAAGALASITDRDGLVTAIERDASGQPVAVVAPNGQRTTLTLDQNGYIASIADPDGNTHQFTYSPDGLMKTLIDPNQKSHTFEYDDVGRLKKDTNPAGGFFAFSSTGAPDDHLVTKTSAEGKSTSYHVQAAFDGSSSKEVTDSAGLITVSTKDPSGKSTISRPDGTVRTVELGPDPRYGMQMPVVSKSTVTMPSGKSFVAQQSRTTTTAADGSLASQVDTTTVNGKSLSSTYDATAHTVTDVSPLGRQTVSTLDDKGRVVQVQAGSLAPTAYAYDSRGRLATVTVGSGTSARVTTFSYDSLDRLASVTDPLLRVQSYVYDDANRVVGQVFTDGSQVGFSYDANGNVTSVTPPSRPEHDFRYTPADLMSSYTPPAVSGTGATTYEYNRDKQPTVVHRPDGSTINFTYDSAGRLSTVAYPKGPNTSDGTVTVTRTYNTTTGKLASVSTSDGQSLSYGYDGKLLLSTTWSGTVSGSVSRTFNNDFRMASQSVNGVNSVAFGYDNDGLLTSVDGIAITRDSASGLITDTTLGQVTDHRTYDTDGLLATYEAKFAGASLYSTAYVRDSLGRIEQKTETIQGTTVVWNYSYDSAGRLWQVMQNGVLTATYLYDANGNRTSVITAGGTQTATYDAQDRLLTYGDWSYTYTANGDLQSKTDTSNGQVTNYAYDAQGNLRHVGLPDGRSIDYVIDGENRRVAKKINGVLVRMWIYKNQLKPVAEFDGAGNLLARYIDWVTVKGSTSYRVLKDGLGTPRLVVNGTTGAVAQRLDFDEWGQVAADSSAGFQVFGFAGGIYDPDTGLVRFGARDYDPVVGRWTAKDPIRFAGGQAGLYVYVMNDPINNRDSGGLGFFDWCMNAWHWLTSWSFSQKYNEAIHSSKECVEGQLDLVDKMSDGEATDEDNNAAQAKCTKSQEDTKETIKKGAEVVTESYMQE